MVHRLLQPLVLMVALALSASAEDGAGTFINDLVQVVRQQAGESGAGPLSGDAQRMWETLAAKVQKQNPTLTPEQLTRGLADFGQFLSTFDAGVFRLVSDEQAAGWEARIGEALAYLGGPDFIDVPPADLELITVNSRRYTAEYAKLISDELASARTIRVYKPIVHGLIPAWKMVADRGEWTSVGPTRELFEEALATAPIRQRQMMEIAVYTRVCRDLAATHLATTRLLNNAFFAPSTHKAIDMKKLTTYPSNAGAKMRASLATMVKNGVFTVSQSMPRIGYPFLFVDAPPAAAVSEDTADWVIFSR